MRKIDPIILLLTGLLIFFTAVLIVCEHYFYQDAVLFAVVSGLLGNVSGALFMGVKNQLGIPDTPPPGTVARVTDTHTVQVEPKDP